MYNVNDEVTILNNDILVKVIITKINLNGTFEVMTDAGEVLRIYREDIQE